MIIENFFLLPQPRQNLRSVSRKGGTYVGNPIFNFPFSIFNYYISVVWKLIYLIIALVLAILGAGGLGWRLFMTVQALKKSEREREELQQDRAIRENLENILEKRSAEVRRLRARVRQQEAELDDLEQQVSDMNISLFHESGLRILREKEDGARRMKLELTEKQLDEATRKLKQQRAEAQADEARMTAIISEQQQTIEKLNARVTKLSGPQSRRARKAQDGLPNQMSLSDLIGDE